MTELVVIWAWIQSKLQMPMLKRSWGNWLDSLLAPVKCEVCDKHWNLQSSSQNCKNISEYVLQPCFVCISSHKRCYVFCEVTDGCCFSNKVWMIGLYCHHRFEIGALHRFLSCRCSLHRCFVDVYFLRASQMKLSFKLVSIGFSSRKKGFHSTALDLICKFSPASMVLLHSMFYMVWEEA